jgi:hypothetical protein
MTPDDDYARAALIRCFDKATHSSLRQLLAFQATFYAPGEGRAQKRLREQFLATGKREVAKTRP